MMGVNFPEVLLSWVEATAAEHVFCWAIYRRVNALSKSMLKNYTE